MKFFISRVRCIESFRWLLKSPCAGHAVTFTGGQLIVAIRARFLGHVLRGARRERQPKDTPLRYATGPHAYRAATTPRAGAKGLAFASRPRGPASRWASSRELSTAACPDAHAFLPLKRPAPLRALRVGSPRTASRRPRPRRSVSAVARGCGPRSCGGTQRALFASAVSALNKCSPPVDIYFLFQAAAESVLSPRDLDAFRVRVYVSCVYVSESVRTLSRYPYTTASNETEGSSAVQSSLYSGSMVVWSAFSNA